MHNNVFRNKIQTETVKGDSKDCVGKYKKIYFYFLNVMNETLISAFHFTVNSSPTEIKYIFFW